MLSVSLGVLACHASNATCLNLSQIKSGKFTNFPPHIASGAQPVSFRSDIFCFGQVVLRLVHKFTTTYPENPILRRIKLFGLSIVTYDVLTGKTGMAFSKLIKDF